MARGRGIPEGGLALPPNIYDPEQKPEADATWGDVGTELGAQAGYGTIAQGAGVVDYLTRDNSNQDFVLPDERGPEHKDTFRRAESTSAKVRDWALKGKEGMEDTLSPAAKRALHATIIPGDDGPSVFDDNVGLGTAATMKGAQLAGTMIAAIVPATIATAVAGPAGGLATGAAVGGAQMMGDSWNGLVEQIRKAPAETMKESEVYRSYIAMGYSDQEARERVIDEAAGYKPIIAGALGAMAGAVGVAPRIAGTLARAGESRLLRGVAQEAEKGFTKRVGSVAGEQAAVGAGLGAGMDVIAQEGEQDAGLSDGIKWQRALNSAIEGGAMGAVAGGFTGAVTPGRRGAAPEAPPRVSTDGVDPGARAAAEAASGAPRTEAGQPVPTPPPGLADPNAPARPREAQGTPEAAPAEPGTTSPPKPAPDPARVAEEALADADRASERLTGLTDAAEAGTPAPPAQSTPDASTAQPKPQPSKLDAIKAKLRRRQTVVADETGVDPGAAAAVEAAAPAPKATPEAPVEMGTDARPPIPDTQLPETVQRAVTRGAEVEAERAAQPEPPPPPPEPAPVIDTTRPQPVAEARPEPEAAPPAPEPKATPESVQDAVRPPVEDTGLVTADGNPVPTLEAAPAAEPTGLAAVKEKARTGRVLKATTEESVANEKATVKQQRANEKEAGLGEPKRLRSRKEGGRVAVFEQETADKPEPFLRRAKTATEQGGDVPAHYTEGLAAAEELKGIGRGRKKPEVEAQRKAAKERLAAARATELELARAAEASERAKVTEVNDDTRDGALDAKTAATSPKERARLRREAKAAEQDVAARDLIRQHKAEKPEADAAVAPADGGEAMSGADKVKAMARQKTVLEKAKVARAALRDRLGGLLDAAKKAKLSIPAENRAETQPHHRWLRQVADMHEALSNPRKRVSPEDIGNFLADEAAVMSGDTALVRERRAAETQHQGDSAPRDANGNLIVDKPHASKQGAFDVEGADTPEARLSARQEDGGTIADPDRITAEDQANIDRARAEGRLREDPPARPPVNTEGRHVAGEDKAGKFAVEKRGTEKRRTIDKGAAAARVREAAQRRAAEARPEATARPTPEAARAEPKPEPRPEPEAPKTPVQEVKAARAETQADVTPAQAEAGNYRKGVFRFRVDPKSRTGRGIAIAIETAKGALRKGIDAAGKAWEHKMPWDYGYVKRTRSVDGDAVDVTIGPRPEGERVFVIDQHHAEGPKKGTFDEPKSFVGFDTPEAARKAFEDSFGDGKGADRFGGIREMTRDEWTRWAKGDEPGKAPEPARVAPTEEMTKAAESFGGKVVWTDGEIGLVAADGSGGNKLYVPATADGRIARVDIDKFQGKGFTPEQTARLKAAKAEAIAADDAATWGKAAPDRNATAPVAGDGKIGRVLVPDNASPGARKIADFIGGLMERFGIDVDVRIGSADDLGTSANGKRSGYARQERDGSQTIMLANSGSPTKMLEVLLHEFGHVIDRNLLTKATPEEKAALTQAYEAWVKSLPADIKLKDFLGEQMTPEMLSSMLDSSATVVEKPLNTIAQERYLKSFSEWFARETAKWLTSNEKPVSMVDRFFKKAADTWRQFYGAVTGREAVNPEVARFLESRFKEPAKAPNEVAAETRATREGAEAKAREQAKTVADWEARLAAEGMKADDFWLPDRDSVSAATLDRARAANKYAGRFGWKAATTDWIRQRARGEFVRGGVDLVERVISQGQKMAPRAREIAEPINDIARRFSDFANKDPETANRAAMLANELSEYGVNVIDGQGVTAAELAKANEHLGKDDRDTYQAKARLAGFQERFEALPAEARKLLLDSSDTLKRVHDQSTERAVRTLLETADHLDQAQVDSLVKKTMAGTLNADDGKLLDNRTLFDALKGEQGFRSGKGMYTPFVRNGEHLVQTRLAAGDLMGGTLDADGKTVVFRAGDDKTARARYKAFAENPETLGIQGTERRFIDKATGDRLTPDEAKGRPDGSYEVEYRARIQRDGLHAFDTAREAEAFIREHKAAGTFEEISPKSLDRADAFSRTDFGPQHVAGLIRSIDNLPAERYPPAMKAAMRDAVTDAAIRAMSGNRFQKHSLSRLNTRGMSEDLARNVLRYGEAQSRNLARLETMPGIKADLLEMRKIIDEGGISDASRQRKGQILNEIQKRLTPDQMDGAQLPRFVKDLLAWSYMSKLASVSSSVINGTQVAMNTFPVLAGRYGGVRAGAAISKAYGDIGVLGVAGDSVRNVGRAVKDFTANQLDLRDPVGSIRRKLASQPDGAELGRVLDEMSSRGVFGDSAAFEMAPTIARGDGSIRKTQARLDRVFRQLPTGVEAVNRAVTAVAAYRLGKSHGMTHEAALNHAFDTTMNTQGDYSSFNTPGWMKDPRLALAVQFKRYAQIQYQLVGGMLGDALKGATPEERSIARKQIAHLFATQIAMGGMLTLPGLELVKVGATLASMVGIGGGYDDVDRYLRKVADDSLGKRWGELVSRGVLTRAIGVDVSSRVSWADLITGRVPDKMDAKGSFEYLGRQIGGAPIGTALDFAQGIRKLGEGDVMGAASDMLPIKTFADPVRGAKRYQEGKATATEVGVNALGFRTSRQAEKQEETGNSIAANNALKDEKKRLSDAFLKARSPADRAKATARIRAFNNRDDVTFGTVIRMSTLKRRDKENASEREQLQGR